MAALEVNAPAFNPEKNTVFQNPSFSIICWYITAILPTSDDSPESYSTCILENVSSIVERNLMLITKIC